MKLGLYIFASLALMGMFGAFVYTINPEYYRIDMLNISLPVAIWIVLPMFVLLVFTLLHMFIYGLKNYFRLKKWQKDASALEDSLYWSLVNEPKEQKFVIESINSSAVLLSKSSLSVSDNIEGLSPRLSRVVNIIQKVNKGEYIDFREEKIASVFNDGNPILIKNRLNKLESDSSFVEDVMKNIFKYSETVQKEAIKIFAQKENFTKADSYVDVFDTTNFLHMLDRVTTEDNLGLTPEIVTNFVNGLEFKCEDFVKVATVTKKHFKPEENLQIFSSYQKDNDKAQNAYLYLLFEYELLDQVAIYLEEQEDDEFIKFRAFYELKKAHTKYKLEDIIEIDSICVTNDYRF